MIAFDGLVFVANDFNQKKEMIVTIECRSESGKVVNYNYRTIRDTELRGKDLTEKEILEGVNRLVEWFNTHTREAQAKHGLKNPKYRPYKPAGFLRRLTADEMKLPQYADAKGIDL